MLNSIQMQALQRIKKELEQLERCPNPNIGLTVGCDEQNNLFKWRATLKGPKDTSYKGGLFILIINFPLDYPNHAPEIVFKTPIYHLNVNPIKSRLSGAEPLGHICTSTLNWWRPEYSMNEVMANIYGLFYMANPDSPYGLDRANEFKYNRPLYEEKIQVFTEKYANVNKINIDKNYYDSWDFTYPSH